MPSPVRYAEVKRLLERCGWTHARTTGSHHIWTKPGERSFPVPVHDGKVKYGYYRQIKKFCGEE